MQPWIVTIDGPAGCGKSTVVRALAARSGGLAFSSGLVYRALTLALLEAEIDLSDAAAVRQEIGRHQVEIVEDGGGAFGGGRLVEVDPRFAAAVFLEHWEIDWLRQAMHA